MRTLPAGMQTHLDSGATTLCHCWKLTGADTTVLGFTDHDRALSFDGVTFTAESGFASTAIEQGLGLKVSNQDVSGALASPNITHTDIAAGRYDGATVEIWRVNWQDVAQRVLLFRGELGEITRTPLAFRAELRGRGARLNQPVGRVYQFACDADLGDARCTVDLNSVAFSAAATVTAVASAQSFTASGLAAFASGWFAYGRLTWTSGANAGLSQIVKEFAAATVTLWEPMPLAIAAGDAFTIMAGCDKRFETCKVKFANALNFRGSPLMPGNDWVVSSPRQGDNNDGGKLTP
ncbi:MAG TPA: beta tubulin [Alphaproteobacteria bacterium]|nr:beta tubulin [Alphaproteobacteria bacterium]HAJ48526.1 beta tubulin [Alphaproteobacteria bacterium]